MTASPFVKWAGGKARLLAQYEPHFPASFGRYIESFVGGGAVFFHLYRQGRLQRKPVFLMDSLEELINCYRVIQRGEDELIAALQGHDRHKADADYYYEVRAWDRTPTYTQRTDAERAARFIFLNRVCYNGLYRVNRKGQANMPFGRYHNPKVCDVANLRAVHAALQGVTLLVADFEHCLDHPLSPTANFTGYTCGSFGVDQQQRLAQVFRQLGRRGCHVMLSNSATDLVEQLYQDYRPVAVQASRPINSNPGKRGSVCELLVKNWS
jgi:DNA adenine methylase